MFRGQIVERIESVEIPISHPCREEGVCVCHSMKILAYTGKTSSTSSSIIFTLYFSVFGNMKLRLDSEPSLLE